MTDNCSSGFVSLATFRAKSGEEAAIAQQMSEFARRIRADGTARQYEFHVSWDRSDAFLLYEEFPSPEDWQRHSDRMEVRSLRTTIKPLLDGNIDHSTWQQFDTTVRSDEAPHHTTLVRFRMREDDVSPMLEEIRRDSAVALGLVRFDLNRDLDDVGRFLICARWKDKSVWEQHQTDPDYIAFRSRTARFYDGPPDRTLWRPLR